jgi:hypothetical protein
MAADGHELRTTTVHRGVIVDDVQHGSSEVAVRQGFLPVEPIDDGLAVDGIAKKRPEARVVGETGRVAQ